MRWIRGGTDFRIIGFTSALVAVFACITPAAVVLSEVVFSRYRASDGSRLAIPAKGVTLATQKKNVNSDDDVAAMLESNGISADSEAFSIVYELNPDVRELDSGRLPAVLNLPYLIAAPGYSLQSFLQDGYFVSLSVNDSAKRALVEAITKLQDLRRSFPQIPSAEQDTANWAPAVKSFTNVASILSVVKASLGLRTQPVGSALLTQLQQEAGSAVTLLSEIASSKRAFTQSDVDVLSAIEDDVTAKAATFDEHRAAGQPPKRWREVKVHVKVYAAGSSQETSGLRIAYVPVVFKNQQSYVSSFIQLTPKASEPIPEGNYFFWAVRDPKQKLLPEPFGPVRVRVPEGGGELPIDLSLSK